MLEAMRRIRLPREVGLVCLCAGLAGCSEKTSGVAASTAPEPDAAGVTPAVSEPRSASPAAPTQSSGSGDGVPPTALEGADAAPPRGETEGADGIRIVGRRVLVDGRALVLRGVCWNPVRAGTRHPEGLDFAGLADRDIPLMVELGVNVVRTYEPLLDRAVLDKLEQAGIRVIDSIYPWGGSPADVVIERVRAVKDHPAILFWSLGNEWNYNGLYTGLSPEDSMARLNEAARLVKSEDTQHPVATIYGELPDAAVLAAMPDIDVWGLNAYRGISFGNLFDDWQSSSDKPMFIAEYGADAYNTNTPAYDPESQSQAVVALTAEILDHASATSGDGVTLGGTLFEWADEWWKDEAGSLDAQDVGGIAPGGGPYPDQVFNEEWWGLVDIERTPRPAFDALRGLFAARAAAK